MGKWVSWFDGLPRPAQLLSTVLTTMALVAFFDGVNGWVVFNRLFYPDQSSPQAVQAWSALIYALVLIAGLPVAFLVWHWRDRNVRDQIENARKDTNLTEFQEVQRNAAGLFDKDMPVPAKEQLQIAALHHLRGFLRGEYGPSFKRPAFELLLAGHAEAIRRIGIPQVQEQIPGRSHHNIAETVMALRAILTAVDRARMLIIRDEATHIFTEDFPLIGRRFDLLNLSQKQLPVGLVMRSSHFVGADLLSTDIQSAILNHAHFEGADLIHTNLAGSDAHKVHFEGAVLRGAYIEGANLRGVYLEGADLSGATFDDATQMDWGWGGMSLDQKKIRQQVLRDLGARHVNDPDDDEDDEVPF